MNTPKKCSESKDEVFYALSYLSPRFIQRFFFQEVLEDFSEENIPILKDGVKEISHQATEIAADIVIVDYLQNMMVHNIDPGLTYDQV